MKKEYLKIDSINGPLIEISQVSDVFYGEVVEIRERASNKIRRGKVIKIDGDKVTVQVFQSTSGLSSDNAVTSFSGEAFNIPTGTGLLGRVFNGIGEPLDQGLPVFAKKKPISMVHRLIL